MRRIVELMVVLFMLVLVVAPASNPSLSVEAMSAEECLIQCNQVCRHLRDDPKKLRLCYDICWLTCKPPLTDVIYRCILECAESRSSTSFGSGTKNH